MKKVNSGEYSGKIISGGVFRGKRQKIYSVSLFLHIFLSIIEINMQKVAHTAHTEGTKMLPEILVNRAGSLEISGGWLSVTRLRFLSCVSTGSLSFIAPISFVKFRFIF